jgi:uncharacterized protein
LVELRLEKEFTVGAPVEQVWRALSDAGVFASSIPGAELRAADGVHTGTLELAADGNRLPCEATMRMIDRDEDEHVATIALHGRQVDGPAIGSVTLQTRLAAADGRTSVSLTAEVLSTGHRPADGLKDAGRELLDVLAERLSERALTSTDIPAQEVRPATEAFEPRDALPVARTRIAPSARIALAAGGSVVALAVFRRLVRGRRRRASSKS